MYGACTPTCTATGHHIVETCQKNCVGLRFEEAMRHKYRVATLFNSHCHLQMGL